MVAAPVTVPAAYYHELSGAVRFWVLIDDGSIVGASINKQTLHYSLGADFDGANALQTYTANGELIDAAVRRRVAGGSIEPVMLREYDVPALGKAIGK